RDGEVAPARAAAAAGACEAALPHLPPGEERLAEGPLLDQRDLLAGHPLAVYRGLEDPPGETAVVEEGQAAVADPAAAVAEGRETARPAVPHEEREEAG